MFLLIAFVNDKKLLQSFPEHGDPEPTKLPSFDEICSTSNNDGGGTLNTIPTPSLFDYLESAPSIESQSHQSPSSSSSTLVESHEDFTDAISRAVGVSLYRWQDFNRHLATLVIDAIEESQWTTEKLAQQLDLPEAALLDYLDPQTPSVIGAYFLEASELLNIHLEEIFPVASEDKLKECETMLTLELSSLEGYALYDHLYHQPGRDFCKAFCNAMCDRIDALLERTDLTEIEDQIPYLHDYLELDGNGINFNVIEFLDALHSEDFTDITKKSDDLGYDLKLIAQKLNINIASIIALKEISYYERLELEKRLEFYLENNCIDSSGDVEHGDSSFLYTEWTPDNDIEYEDDMHEDEDIDPFEDLDLDEDEHIEVNIQMSLVKHLDSLLSGKIKS